jgi:type II secretory pathway pseudopilin PulG
MQQIAAVAIAVLGISGWVAAWRFLRACDRAVEAERSRTYAADVRAAKLATQLREERCAHRKLLEAVGRVGGATGVYPVVVHPATVDDEPPRR